MSGAKQSEKDRKEALALAKEIADRRSCEAIVTAAYDFDLSRCRFISDCTTVKPNCASIIYCMRRDFRVNDNWAMIYSQMLALQKNATLHICFFAKQKPSLYPTMRQFKFLIEGLKEVAAEANSYGMNFYFIDDFATKLVSLVKENNVGAVITEVYPVRPYKQDESTLKLDLPEDVPFILVDAHNIVPVWVASNKEETAARTIRPKITKSLHYYQVEFPALAKIPPGPKLKDNGLEMRVGIDETLEANFKPSVETVEDLPEIRWPMPGTVPALMRLNSFLKNDLKDYGDYCNNPNLDCVSRLSPWLHFGHLAAQRVALETQGYKKICRESAEKFLEELIVRKELADNFCFYNANYDNIFGAKKWAQDTLLLHKEDKRDYVYTLDQFARAQTHDPIWNAAQVQLLKEGRIHNYMRMYWCKKILEWTSSPREAVEFAKHLNDVYALDGNDPNGYVGIMWSICGVHDQGYKERPVFGKIRFMVDYSLVRKFGIEEYKRRYASYKGGEVVAPPAEVNRRPAVPRRDDRAVASTSRGPPKKRKRKTTKD